jgi:putative DNA primase/helicase
MSEQRFVFFWGKGRNGKTTLLEAWSAVMGSYARSIPVETFIDSGRARGAGQATPDLAMLRGIRFVHTDEPDKGTKLSEGLIKRITGGDPLEVRDLHRTYFTMRPVCKITITGNYRPKIQGGESSQGIWRRLILIHWPVTLQITELDKRLPEKLRAEASGILNRMLDGLRDFLDYGLLIPDDVQATTEEFREESDTLGRFLEECTVCDVNASTDTATFHATYVAWAKHHGERVWSAKTFGMAMRERGLRQQRDKVRRWIDIRLIKSTGDFKADEPLQQSDNQAGSPIEDDDVPL